MNNTNFSVHRCPECGQLLIIGAGDTTIQKCCGYEMLILHANTEDASVEKHVPVIARTENGVIVSVGETPHPMEEAHHIEMIAIVADEVISRQFLQPASEPKAEFEIEAQNITAITYCNLHGLWQASI